MVPGTRLQSMAALDRAVAVLKTQEALAQALGVRSPSISGWKRHGLVPIDWCEPIELLTGGEVSRHDLRPDIFGPAPCDISQKVA